MEGLPHLDPITPLSPTVTRILGHNPSKFTLQGTNTYLIGTGPTRLLLDTGEGKPEWLSSIREALETAGPDVKISDVILTHWHPDHVGGVKDVLSLPGHGDVRVWKHSPDEGQHPIPSNKVFHTPGATLTAHHTPGHTTDHMCFLLHEENALFTGDNVLGHGTAVFEDLAAYMSSLEKMAAVEGFTGRAYPAHGDVIEDGRGKVREYISHRQQREDQILKVLEEQGGGGELGSMEIVKVVYKDYPESLWAPAEGGVKQVLRKLEGDGRVVEGSKGSGKWRLSGKAAL
ncbi:hypothetical protein M409DRAFT_35930 [Zasmidium cellare ATCC 36951]|uniref:Metallo-beta-lactamase domain-containing protein n=1 Tax=Zasmidium cellare ATCC 36951 TaxID=1080233 RepID=A0A6A6CWH2_ZASCE|nr:uncharacterized protein M409DRAFT_35930 [Zasmidium cellare ATCC 36951]KAF2170558.1 hypothetical protein M409DRAFT_35930 [Zasmidium cellare ATCC 36951]